MDNAKELSLKNCLQQVGLLELPKQLKGNDIIHWLEAVLLVKKSDFSLSYAIAKRGADGKIIYVADFGNISPIKAVLSIHPYVILDKKKFLPFDTIVEMRKGLIDAIGGDDIAIEAVGKLSDCDVEYQMLNRAIQMQYEDLRMAGLNNNLYLLDNIRQNINKVEENVTTSVSENDISHEGDNTQKRRGRKSNTKK